MSSVVQWSKRMRPQIPLAELAEIAEDLLTPRGLCVRCERHSSETADRRRYTPTINVHISSAFLGDHPPHAKRQSLQTDMQPPITYSYHAHYVLCITFSASTTSLITAINFSAVFILRSFRLRLASIEKAHHHLMLITFSSQLPPLSPQTTFYTVAPAPLSRIPVQPTAGNSLSSSSSLLPAGSTLA